jgi:hypothetical protein
MTRTGASSTRVNGSRHGTVPIQGTRQSRRRGGRHHRGRLQRCRRRTPDGRRTHARGYRHGHGDEACRRSEPGPERDLPAQGGAGGPDPVQPPDAQPVARRRAHPHGTDRPGRQHPQPDPGQGHRRHQCQPRRRSRPGLLPEPAPGDFFPVLCEPGAGGRDHRPVGRDLRTTGLLPGARETYQGTGEVGPALSHLRADGHRHRHRHHQHLRHPGLRQHFCPFRRRPAPGHPRPHGPVQFHGEPLARPADRPAGGLLRPARTGCGPRRGAIAGTNCSCACP